MATPLASLVSVELRIRLIEHDLAAAYIEIARRGLRSDCAQLRFLVKMLVEAREGWLELRDDLRSD
jgi:hypothetical protein